MKNKEKNLKVLKAIALGVTAFLAVGGMQSNTMTVSADEGDTNSNTDVQQGETKLLDTSVDATQEVTSESIDEKYNEAATTADAAVSDTKAAEETVSRADETLQNTVVKVSEAEVTEQDEENTEADQDAEVQEDAEVEQKADTVQSVVNDVNIKTQAADYFLDAAKQAEKDADEKVEVAETAIEKAMDQIESISGENGYAEDSAEIAEEAKNALQEAQNATTKEDTEAAVDKAAGALEAAQGTYDNAAAAEEEATKQLNSAGSALKQAEDKLKEAEADLGISLDEAEKAKKEADESLASLEELEKNTIAQKEALDELTSLQDKMLNSTGTVKTAYTGTVDSFGKENVNGNGKDNYWNTSLEYFKKLIAYYYTYTDAKEENVSLEWTRNKNNPTAGNYLTVSYTKDGETQTKYYNYHIMDTDKDSMAVYEKTKVDETAKMANAVKVDDESGLYWNESKIDDMCVDYSDIIGDVEKLAEDAKEATKKVTAARDQVNKLAEILKTLSVNDAEYKAAKSAYDNAQKNLDVARADLAQISGDLQTAKECYDQAVAQLERFVEKSQPTQNDQSTQTSQPVIIEAASVNLDQLADLAAGIDEVVEIIEEAEAIETTEAEDDADVLGAAKERKQTVAETTKAAQAEKAQASVEETNVETAEEKATEQTDIVTIEDEDTALAAGVQDDDAEVLGAVRAQKPDYTYAWGVAGAVAAGFMLLGFFLKKKEEEDEEEA